MAYYSNLKKIKTKVYNFFHSKITISLNLHFCSGYFKVQKFGGAKQNWTAVQGFADLCLTTRPWHQTQTW